jgi:hypothetical protein
MNKKVLLALSMTAIIAIAVCTAANDFTGRDVYVKHFCNQLTSTSISCFEAECIMHMNQEYCKQTLSPVETYWSWSQ